MCHSLKARVDRLSAAALAAALIVDAAGPDSCRLPSGELVPLCALGRRFPGAPVLIDDIPLDGPAIP